MSVADKVQAGFDRLKGAMRHERYRSMRLGRYVNGVLETTVNADLPSNYVWVFDPAGDKRISSPAKNLTTENAVGAPVTVAFNIHTQEDDVVGIDTLLGPLELGSAAAGLNSPQKPAGMSTPITARDIIPGGVFASSAGGLNVRIGSFWHENGHWTDSADITLTPTGTSGKKSLVLVGVNRLTNTATQQLTTDRPSAYTLIADGAPTTQAVTDIQAVVDAYPAIDWRGAVELKASDTTINPAKIIPLPWRKPEMVGADGATAGVAGLVPKPAATDNVKALFGDGTYQSAIKADGTVAMTAALNLNGFDLNAVNWLNFDDSTELTIASGAITATQTFHRVDTESDAAADDLDTINGGSDGRILVLRAENGGRSVVVKHNTGNIQTYSGTDVTLNETYMPILLVYDGTLAKWLAFGGGGGSATDADAIHDNVAGEIAALTEKVTPASGDLLIIEDSADSNNKKKVQIGNLPSGSGGAAAFGAGVTKTLSSDVASAGSDRHLVIAAESGTADDLIEITGLSAGDEVVIRADAGDTITVKHNDGSATDKIILHNAADIALVGDMTLKLIKTASGKVVQYVDEVGSGTSAAGTYWSPMTAPASPSAEDDEFADNSGGVPSGWTEVDFGSTTTVVEAADGLRLTQSSHAGRGQAGVYKAIPAGDFTIWAKVALYVGAMSTSQFANIGLTLFEDATSSSGDMVTILLSIDSSASAAQVGVISITAYNGSPTGLVSGLAGSRATVPQSGYLRIRRTSSTYSFDFSYDGYGAARLYTTSSLGFTPTHFGFTVDNVNSGADIRGVASFFRYTASDVGVLAPFDGRRVNYYA